MLYLVATPIGHLKDITYRAVETLQLCDYILCEDTRHSTLLLHHYSIHKPLKSFHQFNESRREQSILQDLKEGKNIALISDAGTPGISDPGHNLVKACIEAQIKVVAIPGPCAAIIALTCSSFDTNRFQFYGFLPKKQCELESALHYILMYEGTTICYESPHRIVNVLEVLDSLSPNRQLCIARELTKKFEEVCRGTACELLSLWKGEPPKGEIVLMIEGDKQSLHQQWLQLAPLEHVLLLEKLYSLSRQEAIKLAAHLRGVPKRDIYNENIRNS